MNRGELVKYLEQVARDYRTDALLSINRNSHMNELKGVSYLSQQQVDAVLADYINFVAACQGIDLGLYTSDLNEKPSHPNPDDWEEV